MGSRVQGSLLILVTCVVFLGPPWSARAQESIRVSGVSLSLGMSKGEVLRKLSETASVFRKNWDAEGCELWMDSRKKSEGGTAQQLQFCGDVLSYASAENKSTDADLAVAYPFAASLIDALAHLEAEHNNCTIETRSLTVGASFDRFAEITCGALHVSVSVHRGEGFKFGYVDETLGKQVWPAAKK
jgi:hypothetical protein